MANFEKYDLWNLAIAETLYSEELSGQPAYLDVDDEALEALAEVLSVDAALARDQLLDAVRATLGFPKFPTKSLFADHSLRLRRWRRLSRQEQHPEAPPVLGLLAVAVLAAEQMGAEGGFTGFYKNFCTLLGAEANANNVATVMDSYPAVALEYWAALEWWLTRHDGHRGLPTAYSLTHRYVGLPMSQAIVRQADRRRLPRMFSNFGLPPGYAMSASDMEGLFNQWIQREPCPVSNSLKQLWRKQDLRARISDVVAQELQAWTGRVEEMAGEVPQGQQIRLIGLLVEGLTTRLDLTLGVAHSVHEVLELKADVGGERTALRFLPSPGHLHQLDYTQQVALDQVISGLLKLQDDTAEHEYTRKPRRVIPLRFDDAQAAFVESERVQLAEPSLVLVHDVTGLVAEVDQFLAGVARPGYRKHSASTRGIPAGWVLFSEVEVMLRADDQTAKKFNELVPLASSQLSMHGGFKLPGRLQKWSSKVPPEIRAISQNSPDLRVTLTEDRGEEDQEALILHDWAASSGALFIDLAKLDLADGDYRLELFEGNSKSPTQQRELRLRSSNTVDAVSWFHAPRLWYNFTDSGPFALLAASSAPEAFSGQRIVDGPFTSIASGSARDKKATSKVWWQPKTADSQPQKVLVPVLEVAKNSCLYTGAHRWELPTYYGKATTKYIDGVCSTCGSVRRYPAWIPSNFGKTVSHHHATPLVVVADLEPVSVESICTWDDAFDAVMHVGGGNYGWLERIGLQTGGTQLHVHAFVRALEALGFIAVERDLSASPVRWELSPRYLTELSTGELLLTGEWRASAVEQLRAVLAGSRARVEETRQKDGLTLYTVHDLKAEAIAGLADELEATYVPNAAIRMVSILPSLSEVGQSLRRVPVVSAKRVEQFEVPTSSWVPAMHMEAPGAYRLDSGMGRSTVYRSMADVERGVAAPTSTYLAKHLAAQLHEKPLLAYKAVDRLLLVPRGAELPGLYERAAVLSGGRLPGLGKITIAAGSMNASIYHDVSQDIADALYSLLSN